MYDPIAEINTLRMNGYIVTENLNGFNVNGKFDLFPSLMIFRRSDDPKKMYVWKKHKLLEKIKEVENSRVKMFDLVYYIGSKKVETLASNKPYPVLQKLKGEKIKTGNYKLGVLKIEQKIN